MNSHAVKRVIYLSLISLEKQPTKRAPMSYKANIVQQRSDLRRFLVKSHSMQALESHPHGIPPIGRKLFILKAARFECPASIDRHEQTFALARSQSHRWRIE